jgi:glycosyltransferase involved in cell wall biosynthesis
MTVLQVLPSLDVGGAERATVDVAKALVAGGHRALVMSSGGNLVDQLVDSGAEHFEFAVGRKNPWSVLANRARIVDVIKRQGIDIVHARSRIPAWSAFLATRTLNSAFVTTFHDAYRGTSAPKKFYNGVMARGDRIIAISRFVAEHILAHYPGAQARLALIPRGVDFSVFDPALISDDRKREFRTQQGIPPGVPLLLMPARLSHTKGHELTLQALAILADKHFLCLMIGPAKERSNYRARLLNLARELQLQNKVRFVDRVDLAAAYAAADLVLSASQKAEGFGRVPVEAQAMGVPVIATKLGATSETILDGETGWLVPPGNAAALAQAIVNALSLDARQRLAMAERAIKHVRAKFDVKQMCEATINLYAGLLSAPKSQNEAARQPQVSESSGLPGPTSGHAPMPEQR